MWTYPTTPITVTISWNRYSLLLSMYRLSAQFQVTSSRLLHSRLRAVASMVRLSVVSMTLCACVYRVCVLAPKGKRLELSISNLLNIYTMAVARHALTQKSKGQRSKSHGYEKRHGRMAAIGCCGRVLLLPVWGCLSHDCLDFLHLPCWPPVRFRLYRSWGSTTGRGL